MSYQTVVYVQDNNSSVVQKIEGYNEAAEYFTQYEPVAVWIVKKIKATQ